MSWTSHLPAALRPGALGEVWAGRVARTVVIAVAIWLMAAPALLDYADTTAADSDRIVGPIAGALAFVALWDVVVALRWLTLPCGLWLIAAPLFVSGGGAAWVISTLVAGALVTAAAPIGPDLRDAFDGGWASVGPSRWSGPNEAS